MLPDDLKDFRAERDDDPPHWILAPDVIAALIFAALAVIMIVERH